MVFWAFRRDQSDKYDNATSQNFQQNISTVTLSSNQFVNDFKFAPFPTSVLVFPRISSQISTSLSNSSLRDCIWVKRALHLAQRQSSTKSLPHKPFPSLTSTPIVVCGSFHSLHSPLTHQAFSYLQALAALSVVMLLCHFLFS